MKPFVLIATRPEEHMAAAEYRSFARFAGLAPEQLVHLRIEDRPLPRLDLDEYSGIFLGGSPFNASDADKSAGQVRVEAELDELLGRVLERDFPFLGSCYGIGTLALHLGAPVDLTYGEEVGAVAMTVTDAGRADPVLAEAPDSFRAYVGHKEALPALPDGATLLVTSATCPVQMMRVGENVYATQFHPELDEGALFERLGAYDGHGYYPAGTLGQVTEVLRGADVAASHTLLHAFARRFARD